MNTRHENIAAERSLAFADVIDPALVGEITDVTALGIDIGSRNSKAVLLHEGRLHTALLPTGINMQVASVNKPRKLSAATVGDRSLVA